jgi:hypothetical protein
MGREEERRLRRRFYDLVIPTSHASSLEHMSANPCPASVRVGEPPAIG